MHTSITSLKNFIITFVLLKKRGKREICKEGKGISLDLRDVVARAPGRCQKPKVHCAKVLCSWEWPRGTTAQGWPTLAAVAFWHWPQQVFEVGLYFQTFF